jgi:hypothetical protein
VLALLAGALATGALFVLRLLTAPEPLVPVAILTHPVVACAMIISAFGWGSILGLNVLLPIYLQGPLGLSPARAGLSMVLLMVALNASAALAGQVLGRVRHYKVLPIVGLLVSTCAVAVLAWRAEAMTALAFELTVIAIGAGFGPIPSLTSVAMQNVVPRHRLGVAVGTMTFSRNLYGTMLIAAFGAIVLGGVPEEQSLSGSAASYGAAVLLAAASMTVALVTLVLMQEKPLRGAGEVDGVP